MNLKFNGKGVLEPGIHQLSVEEFIENFGYNDHRRNLIAGLKKGLNHLKDCGCTTVYVDGSFVTKKEKPEDFDACWDTAGTDIYKLVNKYPVLLDWSNKRESQKKEYAGEFFIAENIASTDPYAVFVDFFQTDRDGEPKGIVQLKL